MLNPVVFRTLLVIVVGIGLTACGFKLAGTSQLPQSLSSIQLLASNFNKHQTETLRASLTRAGAKVSSQADESAVVLLVRLRALPDRRLVSGASTGKIVERLTRELDFSLKSADGEVLAPNKTLRQQRDIQLDDDNLLSSTQEKNSVSSDLEKALFNQLIQQLKRL